MSQQRMALWAAEQDAEEEFHDIDMNMVIGNYGQQYDEIPPEMQQQLLTFQQQVMQQAALAQIPDPVKMFIVQFYKAVQENNLTEITAAYESGWNKFTEKFYSKTEWPEAELISPLVNDDPIFLILYRELYYRHVYSRLSPNVDDRLHSYENSCELFNYLLNSDGPVPLELPEQWLWDIIDEFIYQFQVFCTWRSKAKAKSDDELMVLAEGGAVWTSYSVLNVLYSLIQKSKIHEYITAHQSGKSPEEIADIVGEYGSKPLYRMLGYFSIIGLLRVHVLLGDFTLALKVMESVELSQKSPYTRVTACHVSTYYHVGFCYIMLRRYPDAIRTFVTILNFIMRMRQYHTRSYQYDQISKTADRMYSLFAICNCLSPSRLDDNIVNIAKERYGEQIQKMSRGGEEAIAVYEELFVYACPKFICANGPPYEDPQAIEQLLLTDPSTSTNSNPGHPLDPSHRHLALFLLDVSAQCQTPFALRSFLKLYTSIGTNKLANFLELDEEEVVQEMMAMKSYMKSVSKVPTLDAKGNAIATAGSGAGLLDGQTINTSDLNFVIENNIAHITEATVGRRYAGWFIKNGERAQKIFEDMKNTAPKPVIPPPAVTPVAEKAPRKVAWGGVKAT